MTDAVSVFDPGWRLLDAGGDPVSGGKILFTDLADSPINVYSDKGLSSSLGSTVYTGSDGAPVASSGSSTKVPVFIGAVDYKIRMTDADDVDIFPVQTRKGAVDTSGFLGEDDTTSVVVPVVLTSGDLTLTASHKGKLIRCNTTGGALQITLPDAADVGDNWNAHILLDGDATAGVYNAVKIVTSDAGQTVVFPGGKATALSLTVRGEVLSIACDGANFKCMGYSPMIRPNSALLTIVDRVSSAPSTPAAGARYIVSSAYSTFSTGDVIEADGQGGWIVYTPVEGWLAWVQDENAVYAHDGSAWVQQYEFASQANAEAGTDTALYMNALRTRQAMPARSSAVYTTYGALTGTIPADNSIPQKTEGNEILSASITLKSTSSKVRVRFSGIASGISGSSYIITALFRGSGADAVYASMHRFSTNNVPSNLAWNFEDSPATAGPVTYAIRIGSEATDVYTNGTNSARMLGGVAAMTMVLEEVLA